MQTIHIDVKKTSMKLYLQKLLYKGIELFFGACEMHRKDKVTEKASRILRTKLQKELTS